MNFAPAHSPFEESAPEFADVREAAALAAAGQRLDRAAAETLYRKASLHTLAFLAHKLFQYLCLRLSLLRLFPPAGQRRGLRHQP